MPPEGKHEVIYIPEWCNPPQSAGSKVGFDHLVLNSGPNYLTDYEFNALQSHPDLATYVEWGAIVLGRTADEMRLIWLAEWDLAEWDKANA